MTTKLFRRNCLVRSTGFQQRACFMAAGNPSRRLRYENLEDRRMLATLTVTVADDFIDEDDGILTLREAIGYVNDDIVPIGDEFNNIELTEGFGTNDTIVFSSALAGSTIELTGGEIVIDRSVVIDAAALTSGLTIDAGHGADETPGTGDGTRIFESRNSPTFSLDVTLRGLTFTGSDSFNSAGAIGIRSGPQDMHWTIEDSVFENNSATNANGGAIYAGRGTVLIDNVQFIDNHAFGTGGLGLGGAIYVEGTTLVNVVDSNFENNTAQISGGAIAVHLRQSVDREVTIEGSSFVGNQALGSAVDDGGGAIYLDLDGNRFDPQTIHKVSVVDTTIADNHARRSGGGIWACAKYGAQFELRKSTLSGNTAGEVVSFYGNPSVVGGDGGGLWLGVLSEGAALAGREFNIDVANVTISGNEALHQGGGVWIGFADEGTEGASLNADFDHVTITQNQVSRVEEDTLPVEDLGGGGIYKDNDPRIAVTLDHTIVSVNSFSNNGLTPNNIEGSLSGTYNFVGTGGDGGLSTSTNIIDNDDPDLAPLFDNGGPTLTHAPNCGSLTLDAGDPNYDPDGPDGMPGTPDDYDQRGADFTRVFDIGNVVVSGRGPIDIGSVELSVPDLQTLAADFDQDGRVDGDDFSIWLSGLGMEVGAMQSDGDANGDGAVDAMDLMIWSAQFGTNTSISADLDGDGDIDGDDRMIWEDSYGNDAGGDADGDGDTDGDDFLAWQAQFAQSIDCHQWAASAVAFLSLEPGELHVTTTRDEDDGDYSLGDLSLREAVRIANAAANPTNIVVPAGLYALSLAGTEAGDASYNDLDITADLGIQGAGAGFTIIDSSGLAGNEARIFDISTSGASLDVSSVTLTSGGSYEYSSALAAKVGNGASLTLTDTAVVNHHALGVGAITAGSSDITIRRSVFTSNASDYSTPAVDVASTQGTATVTIGESIFALNDGGTYSTSDTVKVTGNVTKINEGNNLYDDADGGFFDAAPGVGDYLGTPDYVVSSMADTFDHSDNDDALSVREAVDLANNDGGLSEIWLPAWQFVLTRDRGANLTDTDVSYGDLDITESLVIRGVSNATSVAWTPGIVDAVFDLLGDFSGDGITSPDDGDVDGSDYLTWSQQNGSQNGTYSADADDDGDVDDDDLDIWQEYYGNTLELFDISV
ncbi:hypothetical protein OAS39_10055 [Pirellulales bacterium]|nr:hypothetical protein [Pirellulales bacterium]